MREADKRCEKCINYRPNVWCDIFGTTIRYSQVNACYDCEFRKEELGLIHTHNGRADQFKPKEVLSEPEKRKVISTVLQILKEDEKAVEKIKLSGDLVKFTEFNRLEKTQNG